MFISDLAIRRPIVTIVAMLSLVLFGTFALFSLDTDEFPDVAPPVVVVSIPYPDASPENVERDVIEQIEEGISGISGVKEIQSKLARQLRGHHRRVRVRQGHAGGDARDP